MPSLLCLHFTVSLVAVFFVVAVTCFVVCLNMLWHFAEMCVKGFKPLKSTSLSVCVFFSFSITLVCSFPDVRMDTSALDAYRLSHCGCTCPILSKVCSNDMSSWQQRHSCHWITSVDSCCPPHPPHSPPPHQISSSFSSSSSFSGQHALSCALHHAHDGVIQREHSASAVCRCSVVLILCLSSSLPLSLPPLLPPPSLLSHFFLLTLSFSLHPLPLYFLPFSHSFTTLLLFLLLSFFGFVSFHQVSKWLYWWSLSNLRYGQFLPYVNFLFCHCQSVLVSRVHAGCRDRINFLLLPNSFVCVCSGDSFTSWHRLVESVTVFGLHVILCALWLSAVRCMRILRIRVRSEADSSESACEFALCKLICTSQVACNDTV